MRGDLAVIETEVELRHHHRPLALGQPSQEPPDLHPVECRFDLVVTAAARDPLEWQERKAPKTPRAADRDDEEPACEVRIVRRRMAKSGDEGVVQRVECALAVAQYREKRSIDARELEAVELGPALCGHHGPPCNAMGGPFSLVRALRR